MKHELRPRCRCGNYMGIGWSECLECTDKLLESHDELKSPDGSLSALNDLLDAVKFLQTFVPDWAKIVPKGLDPTLYGTANYKGDLRVKKKVDEIEKLVKTYGN